MPASPASPLRRLRASAIELGFSAVAASAMAVALLSPAPPTAVAALLGCAGALVIAAVNHARCAAAAARFADAGPAPLAVSLARIGETLAQVQHRAQRVNPLTGLPTRERLLEEMTADIAARTGPLLLGAIRFADFDRLASFDQTAARTALERFSVRLVQAAQPGRSIAQIDRDVIAVWFRSGEPDAAAAELRSLVYVAGQELQTEGGVITPAVEAAAVTAAVASDDASHLLLRVTAALTRPETSLELITVAQPVAPEEARERFQLEQDLARAIAEDQLTMVFQPVADLARGRLIGAEALLRWDHPELGSVSPARFVPVVESMGLSDRYGMWVLNAACREARRWRDEGILGLKVAVNLSARQLDDLQLPAKIDRTLQRHGLTPDALELELTETAAMTEAGRPLELFARLRASGVSLSIDDFGSGWSSLSYLRRLPFDKLKIDREFVTSVDRRRDSRAICKALIELGDGLGLQVLAEGVETAAEVRTLRELGCDLFQGYFVSRPLSGDDLRRCARDPSWIARLSPFASRKSSAA